MIEEVSKEKGKPIKAMPRSLPILKEVGFSDFDALVEIIHDEMVHARKVQSYRVRTEESPRSAVWHLTLDNKEYMLMIQPTDLPDL